MSDLTTQQMIDTIRKGDRLGHEFLQGVADRLESLEAETRERGEKLGRLRTRIEGEEARNFELEAENERLRRAIKNVIAYDHCGECGQGCLVFFEEKPCYANSKPCEEVLTLLKLVWPEFERTERPEGWPHA